MDPSGIRALIERLDLARDEVMRTSRQVLEVKLETVADTAHRYASLYHGAVNSRLVGAEQA
jgi:hypothetical protein